MVRFDKLVEDAMKEVHRNIPRNVIATGKTGMEKEKMIEAIAYSKAKKSKKK